MKILQATMMMDDIIFEGRNKLYGAYQLRKNSGRNDLKATALTIVLFLAAMLLAKFNVNSEEIIKEKITVIELEGDHVQIPEKETPPEQEEVQTATPPASQDVAQQRYVEFDVREDHLVENTDHATMDEILSPDAQISNQTSTGDAPSPTVVDNVPDSNTNGPNAGSSSDRAASASNTIFTHVEEKPEFPGGNDAMMAYIYKNVKYTEIAIDNGIEGTAVVQFVIEKDGSVSNVEIVRDPGGGLGKEAEKVIKSMPRWKPGKQRENPVRVKISAPIKFKLNR